MKLETRKERLMRKSRNAFLGSWVLAGRVLGSAFRLRTITWST